MRIGNLRMVGGGRPQQPGMPKLRHERPARIMHGVHDILPCRQRGIAMKGGVHHVA